MNYIIFLIHTFFIAGAALYSLHKGCEALMTFICLQSILANLFVIKGITLFGMNATAADGYIIGVVCGFHLLQEFYGKEKARKTIHISFMILIFYMVVSQLHLAYIPISSDITQPAFIAIFRTTPRIVLASLISYGICQYFDFLLFGLLKKLFNDDYFVVRNYICSAISQGADTILFTFLGLYGLVPHVGQIIVVSYCIKMIGLLMNTPFMLLAKRLYHAPLANPQLK